MGDLVTVYQYQKWNGEKNIIRGWATEDAIQIFEAVKIGNQSKQVNRSLLDENGKLKES